MSKDYIKIAVGLKEDKGRESYIVPLGAAKAIAFYNSQTSGLNIVKITEECEDRLEIIFKDISAIYHPILKICSTIKERAEREDIELKTGKWKTLEDLISNISDLEDLE
jgi:hypothetical protein